jgi:hypothetical protein
MNFRLVHSSKLPFTPVTFPPKSRRIPMLLTPRSKIPMKFVPQEDRAQDRPFKRIKFSLVPTRSLSPTVKLKALPPSPIISTIVTRISEPHYDDLSSSRSLAINSYAPQHGSPPHLSTAPIVPTSEAPVSESRTKKPLKALASFLGSFLETARNATQMQALTSSRSSVKRKRKKAAGSTGPKLASSAYNLIQAGPEATKCNRGDQTFSTSQLRPLGSMHSLIRTSIWHPSSSAAELAHQSSSPVGPTLLRSLTAGSHLLLESVRQTSIPSSGTRKKRDVALSGRPSYPGIATSAVPRTISMSLIASRDCGVAPPLYSRSHALPFVTSSPQQILAALQPPKAQIILSSSPPPQDFPTLHTTSCEMNASDSME